MIQKLLACTLLLAVAGSASADNKSKADQLFKQGKKLMGEKRYSEACQAFEDSFKLDPGIGGELNVAKCYEDWGKLGRAYKAYSKAREMAVDAKDDRVAKIDVIIKNVEPNVPRLTLRLKSGEPKDVKATLDGEPLDPNKIGASIYLDPGPHTIEYKTESGETKKKVVPVERGGNPEITIEAGPAEVVKTDGGHKENDEHHETEKRRDEPERPRAAPEPGRNQRIAGLAIGGAGVIAIGISSYMTLSARSQYNDALAKYCGNMTNNCDDTGLSLTHDARHEANVATFVFIAGAAAIGGGVTLYLLAPKGHHVRRERGDDAWYVTPTAAPGYGGVVVGGSL